MNPLAGIREIPWSVLLFLTARALSSFGSAVTSIALDIWVYKQTGSYAVFATLAIFITLPGILFAPIAGVLVDRFPRKFLLILCDVLSIAAVLVLALVGTYATLSPLVVGAVVVVLAMLRTLAWPAVWASIAGMTTSAQRPRVNGFAQSLDGLVMILSPMFGALLFELVSIPGIVLLDVATYVVVIAVVLRVKFVDPQRQKADPKQGSRFRVFLDDVAFGFRWIAQRADLTRLLALFVIVNIGCSVFVVAYTPYILSFSDASMLGYCLGLGGLGTVFGGAIFAATGGMERQERGVLVGVAMIGICMFFFGMARSQLSLFLAAFVYGGAISLANASSQTIWQSRTPPEIQGRIFSIRRMIAWGLNPLSILISIPLAVAVFAPLLSVGVGVWSVGQIWGVGQFGALGLMISANGLLCLGAALLLFLINGLESREPNSVSEAMQ